MRAWWAVLVVVCGAAGCQDAETVFTQGRIENNCNTPVPVCETQAACVLADDEYLRGEFPGGMKVIVRTVNDQTRLIPRVLTMEQLFGGTEFFVRAFSTGCAGFDEAYERDKNLFEVAGDDQILEFELDVDGRGDHLIEFFSDMKAEFLFKVEQVE